MTSVVVVVQHGPVQPIPIQLPNLLLGIQQARLHPIPMQPLR